MLTWAQKHDVWVLKCVGYDKEFQRRLANDIRPAPVIAISYKRRRTSDHKPQIQPSNYRRTIASQLSRARVSDIYSSDSESDKDIPSQRTVIQRKPTPEFVKREWKVNIR